MYLESLSRAFQSSSAMLPIRDGFSINQREDRDSLNFLIIRFRKFQEMKLNLV